MTDARKPPAPAGAARLLISAAAVFATVAGWALLALETRHLAAPAPAPAAAAVPDDPFPPLPRLVDTAGSSARPAPGPFGLRTVSRPPPTPVAVTRSSR